MRLQRFFAVLLKLMILSGLVFVGAWNIDLRLFSQYFSLEGVIAIAVVQPLVLASMLMATKRLVILVSMPGSPQVPFFPTFKSIILSYGTSIFLPARISEFLKPAYLRDHAGVSFSAALAALFLERIADLIIICVFAAVSISFLLVHTNKILIALTIVALLTLVFIPRLERPLVKLVEFLPWAVARHFFKSFISHASGRLQEGGIYKAMIYGVIAWLFSFANVAILVDFLGSIPIGLAGWLAIFVASAIGGSVPALPGGFGTYEAAVVFTLKGYGYGFEEALLIALALHISQLILCVIISFFILLTEHVGIFSLAKQIAAIVKSEVRVEN